MTELCLLGTHISDYPSISHGKTRIPGVNDGEEFELVHVSDPRTRPSPLELNENIPNVNIFKTDFVRSDSCDNIYIPDAFYSLNHNQNQNVKTKFNVQWTLGAGICVNWHN